MTKFRYQEFDDEKGYERTVTLLEIVWNDYPYWFEQMVKKYGTPEYVLEHFKFQDFIEDWCTVHWAWKVSDD
jgi:hypothetical protein